MENTQEEGDLFCTPTTQKLPAPTVDGRNPAPFGMYKTFVNNGDKLPTSTGAGFLPSTVWKVPENDFPFLGTGASYFWLVTVNGAVFFLGL